MDALERVRKYGDSRSRVRREDKRHFAAQEIVDAIANRYEVIIPPDCDIISTVSDLMRSPKNLVNPDYRGTLANQFRAVGLSENDIDTAIGAIYEDISGRQHSAKRE